MRRRAFGTLIALAVAALAAPALPAAAGPPAVAAGTYTFTTTSMVPIGTAGGNTFFATVLSVTYFGGVTGNATDTETDVVHKDGSFNVSGTETCDSCTIGGRTGSFVAPYTLTVSVAFQVDGHLTFTTGGGGLAGLHGQGSFTADTYSYAYGFAP